MIQRRIHTLITLLALALFALESPSILSAEAWLTPSLTTTTATDILEKIPLYTTPFLASSNANLAQLQCRYYAGDDVTQHKIWSAPNFVDTAWKSHLSTYIKLDTATEQDWTGIGWYRINFRVDSAAYFQELCLDIGHRGASEVYLDGKFLANFGIPAATRAQEQTMRPYGERSVMRFYLQKTPNDVHTIAVRYSDSWAWERHRRFFASRHIAGFDLNLTLANRMNANLRAEERWYTLMILIVGGMMALCILHTNLLIFTRWKAHLLYALFTGGVAWYFGTRVTEKWFEYHVELLTWMLVVNQYVLIMAFIACVGFFYAVFSTKRPIGIWIIGFSPVLLFWGGSYIPFLNGNQGFLLFMGLIFADIMRIVIRAIFRKQKGAWLLGLGGFIFVVLLGAQILWENKYISLSYGIENMSGLLVVMSFFSIPLAMSIFLSQKIASTNHELAEKLVEVQELTDKTISQEVERKVLQADNDRKTQELEEARKLQLSMLPQTMPNVQGLDIAMFMQTATEVGGDYYDYFTSQDGMLTIAIGDATGHGVKAGTMVAATKSLLAVIAQDEKISGSADVLKPTSPILKRMNLRSMFMALAVARIKPEPAGIRVLLANAGMPSALVFRGSTGVIEEVLMKSMPLGTMANFPYEDREFTLSRGDALIMMSDGFPERFDNNDEILGYDVAKEACLGIAGMTAKEIIAYCVQKAEAWANGAPLNDDMTFVVVRVV
jgi:serine phosphatase RsbU (regulator of sigma subunit)